MTEESVHSVLARAIDPVILTALDALDAIHRKAAPVAETMRAQFLDSIYEAESLQKKSGQWQSAKYALCVWIDELMIQQLGVDSTWWDENRLEAEFFASTTADYEFFERASRAIELGDRDLIEVFYLVVVLGYRGVYRQQIDDVTADFLESIGSPRSIESWLKETADILQRSQTLPEISDRSQTPGPTLPLEGGAEFSQLLLICALSIAIAIAAVTIIF